MSAVPVEKLLIEVPAELQGQARFCTWLLDGAKKRPFGVGKGRADGWNADLATLGEAVGASKLSIRWGGEKRKLSGVGMVTGDGVGCLDLDQAAFVVDGKRKARSWAKPIIAAAREAGCLVEISQSGRGVHIFGRTAADDGILRDKTQMRCDGSEPAVEGPQKPAVEVYLEGQFIALTGRVTPNHRPEGFGALGPVLAVAAEQIASHGVGAGGDPRASADAVDEEAADPTPSANRERDKAARKRHIGQPGGIDPGRMRTPLDALNAYAVAVLDSWLGEAFPVAVQSANGAWKLEPEDLGRSEGGNRLSAQQGVGITDFWAQSRDPDEKRDGARSAIDLLMREEYQDFLSDDYRGASTAKQAARILANKLDVPWVLAGLKLEPAATGEVAFWDILLDQRQPLRSPPFPENILPLWLEEYARHVARRMKADEDAACFLFLAAACAFVPRGFSLDVLADGKFEVSAALWVALIAPPGAGKSHLLSEALKPLFDLERRYGEDHAPLLAEWKNQQAHAKRRPGRPRKAPDADAAKTDTFTPADDEAVAPMVLDRVQEEPKRKRRKVSDVTMEKTIELMSENDDGLIQYADELAGVFGSFDAYRGKSNGPSKDQASALSIYDGKPTSCDRMGRPSVFVDHPHLSILGTIQPAVLGPMLKGFSGNGMLQRFQLVPMARGTGERDLEPLDRFADDWWRDVGRLLLELKAASPGGMTIKASAAAVRDWRLFDQRMDAEINQPDRSDWKSEVLAKTAGLVGRLALGLHLLWWASDYVADALGEASATPSDTLPPIMMQRAGRLIEDYLLPANDAVIEACTAGETIKDAKSVAIWIRRDKIAEFTLRELQREIRRFLGGDAETKNRMGAALAMLEGAGWIRPVEDRGFGVPSKWTTTKDARDGA